MKINLYQITFILLALFYNKNILAENIYVDLELV